MTKTQTHHQSLRTSGLRRGLELTSGEARGFRRASGRDDRPRLLAIPREAAPARGVGVNMSTNSIRMLPVRDDKYTLDRAESNRFDYTRDTR